ncbi:MAG: hypothetical protein CSA58_01175 [Micrococcales bacterium]|nr:MAG: hypothetical protein CSA58_01175 [Micrococcales bacterium]
MELSAMDQRVLGALLEKQRTVPASYPLTLNALRTACNQSSSRDPVTDYRDEDLQQCLRSLRDRDLVRYVWAGRGSRAVKYHQTLAEHLELDDAGWALLTVLLLRGPQAPGQLKTRTERLHPFESREQVEQRLRRLADASLVMELDRRPGQQDARWVHALGPVAAAHDRAGANESAPDLEAVLADGPAARDTAVRGVYAAVAHDYLTNRRAELDRKPFERWLLTRLRAQAGPGPVLDIGCGPGHLSDFLAQDGAAVTGVDLTPAMVELATAEFPDVHFEVGTVLDLLKPTTAAGWAGICAWYSLIHLAPSELGAAFASMHRVLAPGGWALVAVHAGAEVARIDELFGHEVGLDVVLHDPDVFGAAAAHAGLTVLEWYLRGPLPDESPTERFYLLTTKPA